MRLTAFKQRGMGGQRNKTFKISTPEKENQDEKAAPISFEGIPSSYV